MKHEQLQKGRALAEKIEKLTKELATLTKTSKDGSKYNDVVGDQIPIAERMDGVNLERLSADTQGVIYNIMLKDLGEQLDQAREDFERL